MIPRTRSESPAFDLHHPEIALVELDQHPKADSGTGEVRVDAHEQAGRRESSRNSATHDQPATNTAHQRSWRWPVAKRMQILFVLAAVAVALIAKLVVGLVIGTNRPADGHEPALRTHPRNQKIGRDADQASR